MFVFEEKLFLPWDQSCSRDPREIRKKVSVYLRYFRPFRITIVKKTNNRQNINWSDHMSCLITSPNNETLTDIVLGSFLNILEHVPGGYLGSCQTSRMECFCENIGNSWKLLTVFAGKPLPQIFDGSKLHRHPSRHLPVQSQQWKH